MHNIAALAEDRKLVSIRRESIDDNQIQGFILQHSTDLVLLQYVYDFNLDGLLVIRKKDISEVRRRKTDEYQTDMLAADGQLLKIPFDTRYDLDSWKSVIVQFSQYGMIILENEHSATQTFLIGEILRTTARSTWIKHFTGAGNWADEPAIITYNKITSCQVDTSYINAYKRHFARTTTC